jgi:hypothetical protein
METLEDGLSAGKTVFSSCMASNSQECPNRRSNTDVPAEGLTRLDHKAPTAGESADPWVAGMVSGKHISFFLDTGASRLVLTEYAGPLKKASFPTAGVNGISNMSNIISPLYCIFAFKSFTHPFLVIPACLFLVLG